MIGSPPFRHPKSSHLPRPLRSTSCPPYAPFPRAHRTTRLREMPFQGGRGERYQGTSWCRQAAAGTTQPPARQPAARPAGQPAAVQFAAAPAAQPAVPPVVYAGPAAAVPSMASLVAAAAPAAAQEVGDDVDKFGCDMSIQPAASSSYLMVHMPVLFYGLLYCATLRCTTLWSCRAMPC